MKIIYAERYVSPRERPLTPDEQEVRRVSYALKVPTEEALNKAVVALAPLIESAIPVGYNACLMPVPSSTNTVSVNHKFCNRLAAWLNVHYDRRVFVKTTVFRKHPVQSSCVRRRQGLLGLTVEDHAMIRVCQPLTITNTAYYFVDNVATTGGTLEACRQALGFGDGVVYADQGKL